MVFIEAVAAELLWIVIGSAEPCSGVYVTKDSSTTSTEMVTLRAFQLLHQICSTFVEDGPVTAELAKS